MADKTKIGWTDATWPVMTGCTHVSEGCDHCYAAKLTSGRLRHQAAYEGLADGGKFNGQVRLLPERLEWPYRWKRPRRIFVADMGDLFHEGVPDGYIAQVWDVMGQNQQHTYQVLTKRHARLRSWVSRWADRTGDGEARWPMPRGPEAFRASAYASGRSQLFLAMLESMGTPPEGCAYPLYDWMEGWIAWPTALFNVHLGVSAENQKWFDIRWKALAGTPAAVRYVSAEPLLGPIDLGLDHKGHRTDQVNPWPHIATCLDCSAGEGEAEVAAYHRPAGEPKPDWVIAGGESGPGYREMDLAWLESVANQCRMASIPLYVKQDSGPRAGQQGRIPDDLWSLKQFPGEAVTSG